MLPLDKVPLNVVNRIQVINRIKGTGKYLRRLKKERAGDRLITAARSLVSELILAALFGSE
jgi:hypothetical protein